MGQVSIMFRNCIILGWKEGAVKGDILVEDGTIKCIGSSCEPRASVRIVDCNYSMVVMPCPRVAWLLPVKAGSEITYKTIDDVLSEYYEGAVFDEDYAATILSELPKLGVCSTVITVPPKANVAMLVREARGLEVKLNVLALPDSREELEEVYKATMRLRKGAPLLGFELAGASTSSDSRLARAAETAKRLGAKFYVHASYSKRDVYESKRRHGVFPIERLYRLGLLTPDTVIVGGGWVSSWELGYLAETGAPVVYSPAHDLLHCLGGHFPVYEALRGGVKVWLGLGFGIATIDPLAALWAGLLLQRYVYWDSRLKPQHMVEIAYSASELYGRSPRLREG